MLSSEVFLVLRVLGAVVICIVFAVLNGKHVDSISGPHINDLNLLLPPRMFNPVGYRLQGTDGCFSWAWDHHDVLSVEPEYNETSHCSASAHLISIAAYSGRRVTAVHASDIRSGQVIRCEVYIDKISRIQIFHHSIKLDLDGLATLRIHAFDNEDNVFSSLVGLRFVWQLTPVGSGGDIPPHRLVHVPLKSTPLSDCGGFCGDIETQIRLEESGVGSDLYVVRGIDIGRESVSVRLMEPQFEHLSDTIILTVAEAMSLEPLSPLYVIIGTRVHYTLKVLRRNKHQVVNLPSPNHRWFVVNSSVALIDPTKGVVVARDIGITSIVVEDLRVAGHQQISSMHVVVPNELHLYLSSITVLGSPHLIEEIVSSTTPWYFVEGREYVVHLKAFSSESGARPLYLTKSNHLELQFGNSPHWDTFPIPEEVAVKHNWQNCSRLKAISEGHGKLVASLRYYSGNGYEPDQKLPVVPNLVLSVVQEVKVCGPVKIVVWDGGVLRTILLPWSPGILQEIELKAKGGCGETSKDYQWHSSDSGVVIVNALGVLQAKRPGKAIVKVVAIADSMNYDEVIIEVSVPSSMAILGGLPVEAAVGSRLPAAVTLRSASGHFYSRCDAFNSFIRWQIFGGVETFEILNRTGPEGLSGLMAYITAAKAPSSRALDGPVCAWTYLYASQAGRATVHASLNIISRELFADIDIPAALKTSWSVAAYAPLVVQQAGDGNSFGGYKFDLDPLERPPAESHSVDHVTLRELLLVPGTGMKILLRGGPERWRQGVEFIDSCTVVSAGGQTHVKDSNIVTQLVDGGGRLYWISCYSLGNFTLTFKRGNSIGEDHPSQAMAVVELLLICSVPSSITVIADEPANTLALIRTTFQADRAPGHIRVTPVTVTNGRTIRVAAIGIHQSGRPFANSSSLLLNWALIGCDELAHWEDAGKIEKPTETSAWEKFLVLLNVSGQCIVRATVTDSYDSRALLSSDKATNNSLRSYIDHVLTDAVRLQLVSALHVDPDTVLLFFHPDARASLSIFGGTCDVEATVNDTRVAVVVQQPPSTHCMRLVLGARGLGTTMITVQDIGLASPASASAWVRVIDVDWIRILLPEETSLLLGSIKAIELVAGNHDGSVFDSSQFEFMNIHVHLEDEVVELVDNDGTPKPSGSKIAGPKFFIHGANIGLTSTLHVSAWQGSGREILSQFAKVEVYAPLLIHPPRLFLAPGAKYTLSVQGGPRTGVVVEYSSMDKSVASIESVSGRLVAASPGNTSINARAYNSAGDLICEAYGTVNVRIPSSMSLNFINGQLGVGQEMSVFPKAAEGDLFSFYELCRNYEWVIEDEQVLGFRHIESLHVKMRGAASSEEKRQQMPYHADHGDAGFMTRIVGRMAGRTTIGITFSCDFISMGSNSRSVSYGASDTIWVVPDPPLALGMPITWLLPPFYTTSNVLPEWTKPSFRRDSRIHKGHVVYSVLKGNVTDDDAINIKGGCVETSERNNIACIEAKDRSTGRFEIAACVRVAEVFQLTIETEDFPFHVIELSVGTHQHLIITYRDDLGIPFFEAHGSVPLMVDTNHPEIVSIKVPDVDNKGISTNGTLYVQALRQGSALVRVSFKNNPQNAAFILIRVGAYVSPRSPVLHVGGHLNFTVTGIGFHTGEQGHWSSTNEDVVVIDSISGEARALGEGATRVTFKSSKLTAYTTVTVIRVASIAVDAPPGLLTNVPIPENGYNFSVRFSDFQGHNFRASGEGMGVSYDCRVDPSYIGHCKPWRDSITGYLYCLFFPNSPEHLALMLPDLKGRNQTLRVGDEDGILHISVIASLRGMHAVSGSADVIFKGGFSIPDMKKEFHLTPSANKSRIIIVGNAGGVKLHWQAKEFMSVSRVSYRAMGLGGQAEYEVQALQRESFNDKLEITLPTTGQQLKIDVSYEPGKWSGSTLSLEVTIIAVIVCVVLLMLTIITYMRLLDQPDPSSNLRLNLGTESTQNPAIPDGTPVRSNTVPSDNLHTPQSLPFPRTPQPFTEYVRRTMEETPHFRRDGRRRFDPYHTY